MSSIDWVGVRRSFGWSIGVGRVGPAGGGGGGQFFRRGGGEGNIPFGPLNNPTTRSFNVHVKK